MPACSRPSCGPGQGVWLRDVRFPGTRVSTYQKLSVWKLLLRKLLQTPPHDESPAMYTEVAALIYLVLAGLTAILRYSGKRPIDALGPVEDWHR